MSSTKHFVKVFVLHPCFTPLLGQSKKFV